MAIMASGQRVGKNMVWMDYQRLQAEYERTQWRLASLLDKREELETALGPSAIRYDRDKVQTSPSDHVTDILAKVADVDRLIDVANKSVEERQYLLSLKRKELMQSRHIEDKIYVCYYIHRMSVGRIAYCIGYSKRQVYRIIRKMSQNVTNVMLQ